jgi:tRNA nucleotidyltransferase/poly(A) polymerase
MKRRIQVPGDLKDFAHVFTESGYACYFVGGAVRDGLLGFPVNDWDAATDAKPEEVRQLFKHVIPTGIQHGTVTVRWRGRSVETTTFRVEGEYLDGRRPETVAYTSDLVLDLSRRDFTINGMAVDPDSGEVVDPNGGLADLAAGLVRAIGDPVERFTEDGLRPLRAVRFASRLGFGVDPATLDAIPQTLDRFRLVSAERIRDELIKILISERPGEGLRMLDDTGLLSEILPELLACKGVGQGGPHRYDVFNHLVEACASSPPDLVLRLSSLLHDIGKPVKKMENPDGSLSFHGHDQESARLAESALKRLKFTNLVISGVTNLIRNHMFDYADKWSDAAVRRFVARVGLENIKPLILLRLADSSALGQGPADPRMLMPLVERVESLHSRDHAFRIKDLAIGGNELLAAGWPKGPSMGRALEELLEAVLDDPDLNTKERLLAIAEKIKSKHGVR